MTIAYKSFCWNIGTTSFRMSDFNRKIEEQLQLLDIFWKMPENMNESWYANDDIRTKYYKFLQQNDFVTGDAPNKPKDAREKTSGLVDLGLIDDERRLTEVGRNLLRISQSGNFASDNFIEIPKDSYIYLKQLLKLSVNLGQSGNSPKVKPFVVLLYVLSKVDYLTFEEFKYLLPLCTNGDYTSDIIDGISKIRAGNVTIDNIIMDRLMAMDNYKEALDYFLRHTVTEEVICTVGMNRKSRSGKRYDAPYYTLYQSLYKVFVEKDYSSLINVYEATKKVQIGHWWREYLFNTISKTKIERNPKICIKPNAFSLYVDESDFKIKFFVLMHLFKAKSLLSDYVDLNKRYLKIADVVLFDDDKVDIDIVPKHFLLKAINDLYKNAFSESPHLCDDIELTEISSDFVVNSATLIEAVNNAFGTDVDSVSEANKVLENRRYKRFRELVDNKFTDENLLSLLNYFENRNDKEIRSLVTDNASVPTIFEYVLAIIWYKISNYKGSILKYMKLSLDADLLPKTHAAGGEADIVYEYEETSNYPEHSLLLEATLADPSTQRRMEMEPVSRHLGEHLLATGNFNSYCVFATNNLNINVIQDFRQRKIISYYSSDGNNFVKGMKIIPLKISDLKTILTTGKRYDALYGLFNEAFEDTVIEHPIEWHNSLISQKLCC